MPIDNRRLPFPEGTVSTDLLVPPIKRELHSARADGRKKNQSRPIFLRVGVNSNAKGSAYLEMGKSKIMCSVFGPKEATRRQNFSIKGQLLCQFKFAPFSCRQRKQHQQDQHEKELSSVLKETLEPAVCLNKFPKSTIDVFVLVLENDGSALAGAITCAGAAIADAGIDMYDIIVGCSLRQYGTHVLIDPTSDEEYSSMVENAGEDEGNLTIGFMPTFQQVAALLQDGCLKPKTISTGINLLIELSSSLCSSVQKCLLESLEQETKAKEKVSKK